MKPDFIHIYKKGDPAKPALLLLHGTGGDEYDLVDMAQTVSAGSTIVSVRGKVTENGMQRFFKRLQEGVFDQEDLKFRTAELADFTAWARSEYKINQPLYALGFSNGANIAASMMLSRPESLAGAILLRSMVPFTPPVYPDLSGKNILMLSGLGDPIVPIENAERLAGIFRKSGAQLDFAFKPAGHGLTEGDISVIKEWISALPEQHINPA